MRRLITLSTLALLALAADARASLINVTVQGTFNSNTSQVLLANFAVGQAFTVTYSFDSTTPYNAGGTSSLARFNALRGLTLTSGSYTASSTGTSYIQIENDTGRDAFTVDTQSSNGLSGPPSVDGFPLSELLFNITDSTQTVFSDARTLPTTLDFSRFNGGYFGLAFNNGAQIARGTITSVSFSTAVPEPSSLALCGLAGLIGVAGRRLRRLRVV